MNNAINTYRESAITATQARGLGGYPSNGLSSTEIRQPSVLRELEHLQKSVEELQAIFPQLETKIERVTRQEPQSPEKEHCVDEPPNVQLAENIAEQRRAIQRLSSRISYLIQRIEL